ncbi:MAG: FAD-dependent oxidoreductase [Proteobacteria bacterium]|nr:FAD-dependent oxidoreductase [Pseudomonadota bacterium]
MKPTHAFDVLILGGGIAGMTAAIYAARANLETAIIEKEVCGGLVNSTHQVENFPSWISINGMELMEKVLEQVEHLGVTVEQVAEFVGLDLCSDLKSIETEEGLYTGKTVILATGRQPVPLEIDTDLEQIHYCSICDGTAYRGKRVLVVGGGNSGFDEALYLLSLGINELTLIEVADRFFASAATREKLASAEGVTLMTSTSIKAINGRDQLHSVLLENREKGTFEELPVDGIFVFVGQKPATEAFQGILELDEDGYIPAAPDMSTGLAGVFAAGDVVRKTYRQITTAMSDGTIAALEAEKFLRQCDSG